MKEIKLFSVYMSDAAIEASTKVLSSGFIGQGPKVEEFEAALRSYFDTDIAITTNSATSAEHLVFSSLKRMGVFTHGKEVLTTAMTCSATNWQLIHNGLCPKFVDIDPTTFNLDLQDLERKITPETRVIYVTNWGGYPNDYDVIEAIQQRALRAFGFWPSLVSDCAHALGSRYKGKRVGNRGINTFSFQAIKHVTSVDGGAVIGNFDKNLRDQCVLDRWYGIFRNEEGRSDFRCEQDIKSVGYKFHMNDVNAAIGIENLKYAGYIVGKHQENGLYYDQELEGVPGVTLMKRQEGFESSYWIYSMLVERREDFMRMMKEKGIQTSQVHERNDKHTCMREFKTLLPNLDAHIGSLVHIPVHHAVTVEEREHICASIKSGW